MREGGREGVRQGRREGVRQGVRESTGERNVNAEELSIPLQRDSEGEGGGGGRKEMGDIFNRGSESWSSCPGEVAALGGCTGELGDSCRVQAGQQVRKCEGKGLGQNSKVIFKNQDNRSWHVEHDGKKWNNELGWIDEIWDCAEVYYDACLPPSSPLPHHHDLFAPISTCFSFHRFLRSSGILLATSPV